MADAILMLSDTDTTLTMNLSWEGDFDEKSPAHQHMRHLLTFLKQMAPPVPDSEPLPTAVTVARLHANIEAAERKAIADGTAEPMFGNREGAATH
jgi:hypothetical protein